ncbi:hypothetical protein MSSIT_3658 [Methanosarcina siciliae T4/M]|uniref:Uncharacterized protein n=1 Tax=Methanosarcina siciliae T4/M TaxID=1434120 RepID=A0A0E3P8N6_9EURY|nr:hypothetical protein MSSIT_3658 [Methanosarcina siciliae T4/M]
MPDAGWTSGPSSLIYQNKKSGSRCFCTHCLKKSASELKTRKKALGKKNRENGNKKRIHTFGPKNAKTSAEDGREPIQIIQ